MLQLYEKAQKNGSARGVQPNPRCRLVQCSQCHYTHLVPPDCPVESVCPFCLHGPAVTPERNQQPREDRRQIMDLILSVAIGLVAWGVAVWALVRWWP